MIPNYEVMIEIAAMGDGPICKRCNKPVTIVMTDSDIVYHCHSEQEPHPRLIGYKHPEKAF